MRDSLFLWLAFRVVTCVEAGGLWRWSLLPQTAPGCRLCHGYLHDEIPLLVKAWHSRYGSFDSQVLASM